MIPFDCTNNCKNKVAHAVVNVTPKFSEGHYTNVCHNTHYFSAVTVTANFVANVTTKDSKGHCLNIITVGQVVYNY